LYLIPGDPEGKPCTCFVLPYLGTILPNSLTVEIINFTLRGLFKETTRVPSRRSTNSKSPGSTPVEKTSLHSTSSYRLRPAPFRFSHSHFGNVLPRNVLLFPKDCHKKCRERRKTELCGACLESLTSNEPKRLTVSRFLKLRRLPRCLRARFARAHLGWIPNIGNIELERSMLDIELWYRYNLDLFLKDTNTQ
jgi:hypothetical protein